MSEQLKDADGVMSVNDIVNLLGEDDGNEEVKPEEIDVKPEEVVDDEEPNDETKEEKLSGEEDELKPEDDLSLPDDDDSYVPHASKKEILAKYPELFKTFPTLETAYYKSAQYEEVFPSVKSAREAQEKLSNLQQLETQVLTGNNEIVLTGLKQANPEAYNKVVNNYLETLAKLDPNAHIHVVSKFASNIVRGMFAKGQELQNNDLKDAAAILNQYLFNGNLPDEKVNFGRSQEQINPEQQKISEERKQWINERLEVAVKDVGSRLDNVLKANIERGIDPKNVMPQYVKTKAIEDVLRNLQDEIVSDKRFRSIYDNQWRRAQESGFDNQSLDKIRTTYLSRAKASLQDQINRVRKDALGGITRARTPEKDKPVQAKSPSLKKDNNGGPSNKTTYKGKDISGMSTREIFDLDD